MMMKHRNIVALVAPIAMAMTAEMAWAQSAEQTAELAQMRADCRLEGEAGGMQGRDLDDYIEQCIEDLQTLTIVNTESAEGSGSR